MNILKFLKKTEIYFLVTLCVLNLYLAFALRGDQVIDSTHLMMSVIMLIFVNDKLSDKIKKD
mgnify:CR=1 FL=1|tara:strand:- start:581 stop:766 length:186 start_codon:yes stop_codon:yes gene_type:complete